MTNFLLYPIIGNIIVLICLALISPYLLIFLMWLPYIFKHKYIETRHEQNSKLLRLLYLVIAIPAYAIDRLTKGGMLRYLLFKISIYPSNSFRKLYYRSLGAKLGNNVTFHFKTEIRAVEKLTVGKGTIIGDNAILDARNGLTIGENVNLSSNVSIYTEQHNHRSPTFSCNFPGRKMEVNIGKRAWLGSNCIILPGVTIGEGSVVCAGAVVSKDVEPFTVVAGIPARKVGERPTNLTYEFNGNACWFY